MKKRAPLDPNARICQCCGYANIATVSACRLCGTRLPEPLSLEEPPIETPVPPIYKPLPYRSRPPIPSTPQPLPSRSRPPDPPPLVISHQEKPPALADVSAPLAKDPIAPPLPALAALRRRIRSLAQKLERRSQPALLSRLKSQLHHASSWMMAL